MFLPDPLILDGRPPRSGRVPPLVLPAVEDASVERVDQLIDDVVSEFMLQKLSGAAVRRIREHRAAGHRTILITAAAEPFVRPLAPLFDMVIAARSRWRTGGTPATWPSLLSSAKLVRPGCADTRR